MMKSNRFLVLGVVIVLLVSCSDAPKIKGLIDPSIIQFSGDKALKTLREFVTQFPNRDSGQPNNQKAAEWVDEEFNRLGLTSNIDRWNVINYSRDVPLQNVVGTLPGNSPKEIVIVAHFDQSPDTYQGADNDGSGMAILMELAEIFSFGSTPEYTIVFLATDGEEYGMLGTLRYIQTHRDIDNIIAGFSLDNVGKEIYNGLRMDPRGQFRGYGALWFQLLAQEAARSIDDDWVPIMNPVISQILDQAVPVSFMDEGPMVAAGIPSFGFAGVIPPEFAQLHWDTYHSPEDLVKYQSAETIEHTGRVSEAIIRQCLAMNFFPNESGPYLFFMQTGKVLHGFPLWLIFGSIVGAFFLIAFLLGRKNNHYLFKNRKEPLIHFFSLWIPLVGSVLTTYIFVAVGLMDKYHLYPATSKDAAIYTPKWIAVILWFSVLGFLFIAGRKIATHYLKNVNHTSQNILKQVGFFIIGLCGLYLLWINPFSLIFIIPLLIWVFISGGKGTGKILDSFIFLSGGLFVFVLIYFFGFVIMKNGFSILWYLMMMFSIGMVSFPTAAMIMAVIASGLGMVVNPKYKS